MHFKSNVRPHWQCRGCYDDSYHHSPHPAEDATRIYVITALIFVYRRKIEERDDNDDNLDDNDEGDDYDDNHHEDGKDDDSYDNYHRNILCITKAVDDCHDNYHRSILCITKDA